MRRGQRPPKPDQAATRRHRPGSCSAGAAEGIYPTAGVVKEAMRSIAQDALGALSDELATRSSYGEVEAVGKRLGLRVRKGMEGALSEIEEIEEALMERCVELHDQSESIRAPTNYQWWPQAT